MWLFFLLLDSSFDHLSNSPSLSFKHSLLLPIYQSCSVTFDLWIISSFLVKVDCFIIIFFRQDSLCFREDARLHLEECQRLTEVRESIMADVDRRLYDVQASVKALDSKRDALVRERKRLLNTRNSVLCARCQNPLADSSELIRAGMTNLGLRTAGDGQVVDSHGRELRIRHREKKQKITNILASKNWFMLVIKLFF